MEDTVKRVSIFDVPPTTVLHTFSPAVTSSQQRSETEEMVYFTGLKRAASQINLVIQLLERSLTPYLPPVHVQ